MFATAGDILMLVIACLFALAAGCGMPLFMVYFADSIEAASRTIPKVTQPAIEELINTIFNKRIEDKQLDECPLTFQELARIKSSFTHTLLNMLHARIEYPKEDSANAAERNEPEKHEEDGTASDQQPV